MKLKRTYSGVKFKSVFGVATISMVIEYLVLMSDNIIVGNMIGENALNAITLVTPVFSLIAFCSMMVSVGTEIKYSYEVGRGNREEANRYFSQALIMAAFGGIFLTVFLLWGKTYFLQFFGTAIQINEYAQQYLFYMCFMPVPQMLAAICYSLFLSQGGEKECTISSVIQVVTNIGLSIVLCKIMGIGGVSLASVFSNVFAIIALCGYLLTKKNKFAFRWFVKGSYIINALKFSVTDSSKFLFIGIMAAVINFFLMRRFGDASVTVFTVVMNIQVLLVTGFDGIGEAISPLVNVYRGENNQRGIHNTMHMCNRITIIEGLFVMIICLVLSSVLPYFFGIENKDLVAQASTGIRIYSLASIFMCITMMYSSYYLYMNYIKLSVGITGLNLLITPILCSLIFGSAFGTNGVWIGMTVSSILALSISLIYVRKKYKDKSFPLLLDEEVLKNQLIFNIPATEDAVMDLINQIEKQLVIRGVEKNKKYKIMLMIEETQMLAVKKHNNEKVVIECSLLFGEKITLILRDSGAVVDLLNEDETLKIDSLQAYTAMRLLSIHKQKAYLMASGSNRIIFYF